MKSKISTILWSIVWILIIGLIPYLACNSPSKEDGLKEKTSYQNKINDSLWSIESEKIRLFIINSNADTNWATEKAYTYQYQDKYINKGKLICFMGKIIDIYAEDSIYFIKILYKETNGTQDFIELKDKGDYYFNDLNGDCGLFISKILVDKQTALEIIENINHKTIKDIGYFIFKVSKIKSMNPFTNTDEDIETHEITQNFNTDFQNIIFEGTLEKYYLLINYDKTKEKTISNSSL